MGMGKKKRKAIVARKEPVIDRFWKKVAIAKENECWVWIGRIGSYNYGVFDLDNKAIRAHRFSYIIHFGEIPSSPPDLCVCHTCDNPSCVNPAHLWLGTRSQNMQDKIKKGRGNYLKGIEASNAILTEVQVKEIKQKLKNEVKIAELSKIYGVSRIAIWHIKKGHNWKHI
jgi:hypothetical protein